MAEIIPPRSGVSLRLKQGQKLLVRDPMGQQVSDLFCFNAEDTSERLCSGRSIDDAERILLSNGDVLRSNRGRPMLTILHDYCGRHDFLMPPCRHEENGHPGCHDNLAAALRPHGISAYDVGVAFNVFMHVAVDENGRLKIHPPLSRAGDEVLFEAHMDLLVGLTACAHLATNNGQCKPIQWEIRH